MDQTEVPLFPLGTVLCPEGVLTLQIFEQRYIQMVAQCMKENLPFGVVLITEGREVGLPPQFVSIGTLARIVDFRQQDNGLLGITALGEDKFSLMQHRSDKNQLSWGKIQIIETEVQRQEGYREALASFDPLLDLLRSMVERLQAQLPLLTVNFDNAYSVSYQLANWLPVPNPVKQEWLEMSDPIERLKKIQAFLQKNGGTLIA